MTFRFRVGGALLGCLAALAAAPHARTQTQPGGADASALPAHPAGETAQLVGGAYDPAADRRADRVLLRARSGQELAALARSWAEAGLRVERWLSLTSDPGGRATAGALGARPGAELVDRDELGRVIGDPDPDVIPTDEWLEHLKREIDAAAAAGLPAIWLEAPGLASAGGHGPAFRIAWNAAYGREWTSPHSDPAAIFQAGRLRAELQFRAADVLARHVRDVARRGGGEIPAAVACYCPAEAARLGLNFPAAGVSRLSVSALLALSPPAPADRRWVDGTLVDLPFESDWLRASYFAGLLEGMKDRKLLVQIDREAGEPASRRHSRLIASLMFSGTRGALTGAGEAPPRGGFARPETVEPVALAGEMGPAAPVDYGQATQGIGVLILETAAWQTGGPEALRWLDGLTLPLLRRGIPVELVPGERAGDRDYLARFRVLLVCYDGQKPIYPEINQALVDWARAGGALMVFGGEDRFNAVPEWWDRSGLPSPTQHLLREAGVQVDLTQRRVLAAAERFAEVLPGAGGSGEAPLDWRYIRPFPDGEKPGPFTLRFDSGPGRRGRVGRVRVVENGRVRADFVAGAAGERPFLAEASLTSTGRGFREVTGDGVFSYRFQGLGPDSTVELEIGGSCRVGIARGVDPLPRLRGPGGRSVALGSELPIVLYPLTGARPLVTVGEDAVSWLSPCGAGWLLYCGVSPAFAAGSAEGAECFRDLVRAACEQVRISPVEGPLIVRRGSLVMAHAFGRTARLAGSYLDLLKPGQPLVRNPALPYRLPALFREVRMQGRTPAVIHATHRCRVEESDANRTRLTVEGPEGTRGMICLFAAGQTASALEATAVDGRVVAASLRAEGGLVRVETPLAPRGIMLTLKWSRPEARLTK